jgi:hypothetical protein
VSGTVVPRSGLDAEGDQVGADFRLGERTGGWRARRYSGSFGCGMTLAVMLAVFAFILFVPFPWPGRPIAVFSYLGLLALAVLLLAAPGRSWKERVFLYTDGIAQFTRRQSEPTVVRWADLATMSLKVVSGYEGDYIGSCILRDRVGNTLTVESRLGDACDKVTAAADRLLAYRLAPALQARYDAGEPVTFGRVTVDHGGISSPEGAAARPWSINWRDISEIELLMYGHRITITHHKWRTRKVSLDGAPNDFLARYVIGYAASRTGVRITGRNGALPGEGA